MNYIYMLGLVVFLALFDWLTGLIKAYVIEDISSKKMRVGGMKKIAEILIMVMGVTLDIIINQLAHFYPQNEALATLIASVCAVSIFVYIVIMEVVSVLENYAAIFPNAAWAIRITKKLKNIDKAEEDDFDE